MLQHGSIILKSKPAPTSQRHITVLAVCVSHLSDPPAVLTTVRSPPLHALSHPPSDDVKQQETTSKKQFASTSASGLSELSVGRRWGGRPEQIDTGERTLCPLLLQYTQ